MRTPFAFALGAMLAGAAVAWGAGPEPGSQTVALTVSTAPAARADVISLYWDGTSLLAKLPDGSDQPVLMGTAKSYTAANIAAVANAVNTSGKVAGLIVWDTTNNRYMRATGATAAATWKTLDGVTTVTPA